jgi:hypothetical protein
MSTAVAYLILVADENSARIVVVALALIVLLIAAFAGMLMVKHWLLRADDTSGGGFTLGELRALHRAGQISDAEFERVRNLTVGRASQALSQSESEKAEL